MEVEPSVMAIVAECYQKVGDSETALGFFQKVLVFIASMSWAML